MSNNCTCAEDDTPLVVSARTLSKWSGWGQSDAWLCAAIVVFSFAMWCTCIRVSCHYAAKKAWTDRARMCANAVEEGEQEEEDNEQHEQQHRQQDTNAANSDRSSNASTDPPCGMDSENGEKDKEERDEKNEQERKHQSDPREGDQSCPDHVRDAGAADAADAADATERV